MNYALCFTMDTQGLPCLSCSKLSLLQNPFGARLDIFKIVLTVRKGNHAREPYVSIVLLAHLHTCISGKSGRIKAVLWKCILGVLEKTADWADPDGVNTWTGPIIFLERRAPGMLWNCWWWACIWAEAADNVADSYQGWKWFITGRVGHKQGTWVSCMKREVLQ